MNETGIGRETSSHQQAAARCICGDGSPRAGRAAAYALMLLPIASCSTATLTDGIPVPPKPVASLSIAPTGSCVDLRGVLQFTVTATNISTGVDWYIDGTRNGDSASGTITDQGAYAAPASPGAHEVKVISQVDPTLSAVTSVRVAVHSGFVISPDKAGIPVGGQQPFQGLTCDASTENVTWTVDDVPGGNDAVGSVTSEGIYTAPLTAGTHSITAIDQAGHKSSSAVTIQSGIIVDFGSRASTQFPIPAGVVGVNHVDWLPNSAYADLIHQAGFTLSRTYANLPDVFRRATPDWTQIDPQIAELQAAGFHVLLQLSYTPAWLQPARKKCADPTKAPPIDVKAWAHLAKLIVAHLDAKFPGVVTDYEIWNEPDSGGMCTTADKLDTYLALYAATAPVIRQQAAADGATIRVGGPAISSLNREWFGALLSNPATAPYVDFVSYHQYILGRSQASAAWDVEKGSAPLFQSTQHKVTGAAAIYVYAAQLVAAGTQPLGAATPIYVDEFNTNWAFLRDCCRNDPTYAPVWNGLYISDLLNTAYSGVARVPGQMTYYSANTHPYFCLVGEWNTDMDCELFTAVDPAPYPQYYAFQMLASTEYLGLNDGGYLAPSVSPAPDAPDLAVTGFYTRNQNSVLIVNPTGQSYSELVILENAGLSAPDAVAYRVVDGRSISHDALTVTQSGTVYTIEVNIPAYSVLGISLR